MGGEDIVTRQEAAWLLATLAAPYPGEPFTDEAMEVWYNSTLAKVDIDTGMTIVERLIVHDEFRPTPAVFNEALRTARKREAIAAAGVPALEAAKGPVAPVSEVIAGLRKAVTAAGSRGHWHGGPSPCPVCHPSDAA